METRISYPAVGEIIEFNLLVLGVVRVKKADRHHVLSRQKIASAIGQCRSAEGGLHQKAAVLMRALVAAHAFASGNRRTAFVATKDFVLKNGGKFSIPDDPHYAGVMRGIRESGYSDDEIAEWIRNGKIRQHER